MHFLASMAIMALTAAVKAMPITPAAPELQRLAEQLRSEGVKEHDIIKQLSLSTSELSLSTSELSSSLSPKTRPVLYQMTNKFHGFFHAQTDREERDVSGDIAPGSLEGPVMLPRAAAPESRSERLIDAINIILRRSDVEGQRFAYEGKEAEMRRPEGMRHWDS